MPGWITRAIEGAGRAIPARMRDVAWPGGSSVPLTGRAEREALYAAAVQSTNLAFLTTDANGVITA